MSTEEFSTRPLCKKRFKGVENFLKRIAFNLGNTPSQTEVKIISCIPIDVTDLQQKIIILEKELEDANAALQAYPAENPEKTNKLCKHSRNCKKKSAVNTITSPENLSRNNSDISQGANQPGTPDSTERYYGQPGKACNMDHNHNQTVKPYNMDNYSDQPITPCDMDNYYSQPAKSYNMKHYYHTPKTSESKPNYQRQNFPKKKTKLFKSKKKCSPCVYYAQTYSSPFIKSNLTAEAPKHEEPDAMTRTYLAAMVSRQYKPEILGDHVSLHTEFSSPICRDVQSRCEGNCHVVSDVCSCCHGPFQNIDEDRAKQNTFQTYMVRQINTGNAFYNTDQYDLVPEKEKPVKNKKDSDRPRKKELRPYLDMKCWPENVRTKYRYQPFILPTSNHYTARPRADYTDQRHRRQTRDISDKMDSYGQKMPATFNRTEPARILPKRRMCRRERSINIETSRSCCIDFGNIYPKKNRKISQKLERSQPIPVPKKNAECLTTAIDNRECQTEMSNMEVASVDNNKTEVTLNQIKSILQSVLAEVKVSSQTKSQLIQNKRQKDAIVQKGPSRNNMQASSLMNSVTYSPYAMNVAPYVTSCSRQISPNQFCYNPHGGLKCFHNFPVFIQTSAGRNMCSSCYRSSQIKPGVLRQATTTATNTDQVKAHHSRETDKLIKEIYNSMALTIDFPQKDTSLSEYNEPMKSQHGFKSPMILKTEQKKQPKTIKNVMQAVSELFMKKDMIETSDTFNSTVDSKATSHEASVRSRAVTSTDTELRTRKDRLEKYMQAKHKQPVELEVDKKTFRETIENSITESESSSSEAETDTTALHQRRVQKDDSEQLEHKHKKGKEGLLTKMFKSVKLFKTKEKPKTLPKRVEKKDDDSEEETSGDSDDYQTVYSQKIEKNLRHRNRPHNLPKRKTHSKISYKQTYQRDRSPEKRRSPYMEQENRRYWDEKLMFHNNNPRYSSERRYSEQSSSQNPVQNSAYNPAYYKAYEARTVLVEPSAHVPAIAPRSNRAINNASQPSRKTASKGMAWLKKQKMGIRCGPQWKQLILEG